MAARNGKRKNSTESDHRQCADSLKASRKWVGVGAAERAESAALCCNLFALLGLSTKERGYLKQHFKHFSVGNAQRKNL
ncbi:hypothetical protein UF36_00010 (plasmid) [Vibrio parahaemolyticus]|uniref:hypothetical protein n=1 Tax=Vibrio parahaemolyticus TaxID=670 RepID=UPI00062B0DB6|nr:hypothetical protein [Vibrio parahaemolyticus]KKX84552.1 hypothetical protein UF36_00010 [Vibrio parahaemolyticus]